MSLLDWLFGKDKQQRKPLAAKKLSSQKSTPNANATASNLPKVSALNPNFQEALTYSHFSEIPKFTRIICGSSDGAIPLPNKDDENNLVAINTGGNEVIVIVIRAYLHTSVTQSIRGAIVQAGFVVKHVACADTALIKAIVDGNSSGSVSRAASSKNEYAKAIDEWVAYAVKNDATDIHMKCDGTTGLIRFRVHGELVTMEAGSKGVYPSNFVGNCIATLYNNYQQSKSNSVSIYNAEEFVSCMIPHAVDNKRYRLRFQNIVGQDGPSATCRLLPEDDTRPTPSFKELGYAESHVELWESAIDTPTGAIVIAGITGSGKSTTMKSFIELNPDLAKLAVFTIEDPVEYKIKGAVQIPIQRDLNDKNGSGAKFNTAVAALMRADPDIGGLGEIRDENTANAMQQLAETGHMAIGTTHANQLSGIVPRLTNSEIGMSRETLSNPKLLTLLVYQALVPVMCPSCSFTYSNLPSDTTVLRLVKNYEGMGINVKGFRWKNPFGCAHCNKRGTIGVTVVAEMFMPDQFWLNCIRESRDWEALKHFMSFSDGLYHTSNMDGKTVYEHTLYKASLGLVDARQCQRFSNLKQFMELHQIRRELKPRMAA